MSTRRSFGGERQQVRTVGAVDRDAPALRHVADHRIARHRLAALGVAHHQPVDALDLDAPAQPDPVDDAAEDRRLGLLDLVAGEVGIERADHLADGDVAPAHRDLEAPAVGEGQRHRRARRAASSSGGSSRRRRTSRARISLPEREADRLFLVVDPLPDLVPRAGGAHVASQSRLGLADGAGEDLDRVAVLELAVQRRDAPVDLGALAVQPDLGVHVEREVDRRRALGQLHHVALRREDEDLVLVQVDLEELEELLGPVGVQLQLEHLAEPAEVLVQLVRRLPSRLYSQCAAMPNSAVRCISRVRIWISKSWPPGPKTVVCSDW